MLLSNSGLDSKSSFNLFVMNNYYLIVTSLRLIWEIVQFDSSETLFERIFMEPSCPSLSKKDSVDAIQEVLERGISTLTLKRLEDGGSI